MTEGDSPLAEVLREVLANTADPLHRQTCDLEILYRSLQHVATENQFADVFTKAPTAPMLRLLKTLMDGAARIPLLARLYQ